MIDDLIISRSKRMCRLSRVNRVNRLNRLNRLNADCDSNTYTVLRMRDVIRFFDCAILRLYLHTASYRRLLLGHLDHLPHVQHCQLLAN